MTCNDNSQVNPAQSMTFTLTALNNAAPVVANASPLANLEHLVSPTVFAIEIDISGVFTDAEGEPLYYEVLMNDDNVLDSSKLIAQVQDGKLLITVVDSNTATPIGSPYALKLVAYDPLGQSASSNFDLLIYGCHSSCQTCSGKLETQCLTCPATVT